MSTAAAIGGAAVLGAVSSRNASKRAARSQEKAIDSSQQFTRESTDRARADIMELFPQAQQSLQGGFQGALDVFGQSVPQQSQAFIGGNVNAQNTILSGLPQIQNALLGNQVDLSQLQPQQLQPDFSFLNQPLVQPQQTEQAQQTNMIQPDIGQLLGGVFGGQGGFSDFGGFNFNNINKRLF